MNAIPLQPTGTAAPREQLRGIILEAGLLAWLGDLLLWDVEPGLALAIYVAVLGAYTLCQEHVRKWSRRTWLFATLFAIACVQAAVEISPLNIIVLGGLLLLIFSARYFAQIDSWWGRCVEAALAIGRAPARWPWLMKAVANSPTVLMGLPQTYGERGLRLIQALAPAVLLSVIFAALLSAGNAVLRQMIATAFDWLGTSLLGIDFSISHAVFLLVIGTLALAWVRPDRRVVAERIWSRTIPRWSRPDVRLAFWQSAAVLLMLNVLFFAANTTDAIYLWFNAVLPQGIAASAYVHHGVYTLIFAVLLSAAVLAGIFQQSTEVTNRRLLRVLAYAWIAQNIILIASVFLRLRLYVEAYQLTELRVYVACFIILVLVGFALLTWHVAMRTSFSWLLGANAIATFALFFLLQIPDTRAAIARFNVSQWERQPYRILDLAYIQRLGPTAWPEFARIAAAPHNAAFAARARDSLKILAARESHRLASQNWRSIQLRGDSASRRVIQLAAKID